jgi:hypothetical protein
MDRACGMQGSEEKYQMFVEKLEEKRLLARTSYRWFK